MRKYIVVINKNKIGIISQFLDTNRKKYAKRTSAHEGVGRLNNRDEINSNAKMKISRNSKKYKEYSFNRPPDKSNRLNVSNPVFIKPWIADLSLPITDKSYMYLLISRTMKLDTSDIVVYEITKRYKIQIKINFKRRNKFILKSKIIHEIRS